MILDAGWQDEYVDPMRYEHENPWGPDDAFFLNLACATGGPVLDVGCGTGRLARAMAAHGLAVTALEPADALLTYARSLDPASSVTWCAGAIADLDHPCRYRLIMMTGHAFQHLIGGTARTGALAAIQRHLTVDGVFAFDVLNPACLDLGAARGRFHPHLHYDTASGPVFVETALIWDGQAQTATACFRRHRSGGQVERTQSQVYFSGVEDLDETIARAGMSIIERFGDWNRQVFHSKSPEIITLCR